MNNLKGFAFGILTSATFGLIPLFTLPLMAKGMQFDSILFYRFLFAALALTGIMAAKNESFHVEKRDIPVLVLLGFFYTASAMFLFWGYNFMSAGIATKYKCIFEKKSCSELTLTLLLNDYRLNQTATLLIGEPSQLEL